MVLLSQHKGAAGFVAGIAVAGRAGRLRVTGAMVQ